MDFSASPLARLDRLWQQLHAAWEGLRAFEEAREAEEAEIYKTKAKTTNIGTVEVRERMCCGFFSGVGLDGARVLVKTMYLPSIANYLIQLWYFRVPDVMRERFCPPAS